METILVTGAGRGIGKALVDEFLSQGWHVFAGMRKPVNLAVGSSGKLEVIPLDVTSDESVAVAVEMVRNAGGGLRVLVNNAGIMPEKGDERMAAMKLEWFRESFETNVIAVARMIQKFQPLLSSGSRIVNISSALASISSKNDFGYLAYSTSKAALNMLTRTVAAEFTADGIIAVAISPGWVRTDMGGTNAPLTPAESARSLFRTITHLNNSQSGSFLDRDGSNHPW